MATDWSGAIEAAYGAALFLLANGALGYTAHLTVQRLMPSADRPVRVTASCVIFLAAIVVLAQTLAPFGLYTREMTAVAALLAASAAHRRWDSLDARRADPESLWETARGTFGSAGAVLIVPALFALFVAVGRALSQPPLGWDSLMYHLPFAVGFVQSGRLIASSGPLAMDHYVHFPKNGEILASWLLLPFRGDLIVGLMNVGMLILCWTAACALAGELGADRRDAALAATAVCASPFLYSFATTQNPDVLVCGSLVAAALFVVRYAASGDGADAWLASIAAGLALGAKYTALPLGGLLLCALGVAAARGLARRGRTRQLPVWLALGLLSAAAVGARQYTINAATTGNPIYPLTIAVDGRELPGSPYTDWLIADAGLGSRGDDRFQFSGLFHYYPAWKTPTSAGPKFVLLIALGIAAAVRDGRRRRWMVPLLVAFAVVAIAAAELPTTGLPAVSRRVWPDTARFMGASWTIFAVAGMATLSRIPGWLRNALQATIVAFILWDLSLSPAVTALTPPLVAGALALAAGTGLFLLLVGRGHGRVAAAAATAAVIVGTPLLAARRTATRWRDYANAFEVDSAPRDLAKAWQLNDDGRPLTIALTTGPARHGQNTFVYPLMGARLQNIVTYVPLNESDPPGSKAFVWQEHPNASEWIDGIRRLGVQRVVVPSPWPIEDDWMRRDPEEFVPLMDDSHVRVYQTRPDTRGPARVR